MKLCPLCGNIVYELIDGLCKQCNKEKHQLKIKDIKIDICVICKKYLYKNKWNNLNDIKTTLKKIVSENLEMYDKLDILLPEHKQNPGIDITANAIILIHANEYNFPISIKYTYCHKCSKIGSTYFEGILQLRNPTKEAIDFIEKDVRNNNSKGVFITKKQEIRTGIDYYITTKEYLRTIGKKLKKRFKGELNISPQLFSRDKQTSKDLYRINVLFRMN